MLGTGYHLVAARARGCGIENVCRLGLGYCYCCRCVREIRDL